MFIVKIYIIYLTRVSGLFRPSSSLHWIYRHMFGKLNTAGFFIPFVMPYTSTGAENS